MGARGKMGRGGVAERVANPAFKMASAANMADEGDLTNFHRPFHDASQTRKVICPENECVEKLLFFENSGLNQHFRIIHKKEAVANKVYSDNEEFIRARNAKIYFFVIRNEIEDTGVNYSYILNIWTILSYRDMLMSKNVYINILFEGFKRHLVRRRL